MDQARRLKLGAFHFRLFWIGGMLWWSGEYHPAYIIILTICGAVGGYLWYLAMRWMFQRHALASAEWRSRRPAARRGDAFVDCCYFSSYMMNRAGWPCELSPFLHSS